MVATHLNCFQEINKLCQIFTSSVIWKFKSKSLKHLLFFLFLPIMGQNTLCCLYLSLTAWREPPLLLRYKSCIRRAHSFKSAGLYPELFSSSEDCQM